MRSPNKISVKDIFLQLYSEVKANLSLGLETPRLGIVWFLVSLPLVWERQGREQYGSPVNILPCLYAQRTRSVKTILSLGLETPRLGTIWFLVSLPFAWERQGREQYGSQLKSSLTSIR